MTISETLDEVFQNTWWFSDVAFIVGMSFALNSTKLKSDLQWTGVKVNEKFVLGGNFVPQTLVKSLELVTPIVAYNIIWYLMLFCFTWNMLTLTFSPKLRSPLTNVLYFVYPLLTAFVSAHDILLHSTKKDWPEDTKRRHVLFPINLEAAKVFQERLTKENVHKHLIDVDRQLKKNSIELAGTIALATVAYKVMPNVLYFLTCLTFLPVHRQALLVIDLLFDRMSLMVYRNKYEHFFGDLLAPVRDNDKHDFFGRQYQYFNYSSKALEKVCKDQFFMRARKQWEWNVAESKAFYYLGRGVLVSVLLMLFNLVDRTRVPLILAYYAVHAFFGYSLQGATDHFDDDIPRYIAAIGELELAGFLFYMPVLDFLHATYAY